MSHILEDLFYGNINPSDKCFDRQSTYAKFAKTIIDNDEKLMNFLKNLPNTQEEQHLLSQMINAQGELAAFTEFERFIEGFRLGAGVMLETFVLPQQSVIRDIC